MTRIAEISQVALQLFFEKGYNGTSMQDIAEVLHMRAPSLYNHVGSKQEILRGIMFDGIESIHRDFRDAVAGVEGVADQIRCGAEAHVRHHARRALSAHVNTYELLSLHEPARTEVLRRRQAYARAWIRLIERGDTLGVCHTPSPRLAAYAIIDMGIGVARWYRPDGPLPQKTLTAIYGQLALRIVGVPGEMAATLRGSAHVTHGRACSTDT